MPESRAAARYRKLLGLPEPAPPEPAEPVLLERHSAILDHWFANGCQSKRAALVSVGMAPNGSPQVFRHPAVLAEIVRRRARMTRKHAVTEDRIIQEYEKIAFAALDEMLEIQPDGSAWIDMAAMTDDQKAALAEYHVDSYQELGDEEHPGHIVKKSRVKFHDKKAALDSLARIMGMFKDKLDVSHTISLSDKVQQRRERLAAAHVIEGEVIHETA